MTSSTDTLRADPFPSLGELLLPRVGTSDGVLAELRGRAEAEGYAAGFDSGRAAGFDAGVVAGRALVGERVGAVLDTLTAEAERALSDAPVVAGSLGSAVVDAALALAAAVLGRELAVAASPGRDALLRALTEAPDEGRLVARLHPTDVELLDLDGIQSAENRRIEVVADPSVEPGGCLLDTPTGRVDALLSTALARAAEVLGATDNGALS